MENITSGALSVRERPFHSAMPNTAGVPTSYGRMLGQNRRATFSPYDVGSSAVPLADTTPAIAFMTVSPYVAKSSAGRPALRRLPRSSLYWVNSGWIMGRPTRLIERHPPASVASVDRAHTPTRRLSPALARSSLSGTSSTIEYTVWPANRFLALAGSHEDKSMTVPSCNAWPTACSTSGSIQNGSPALPAQTRTPAGVVTA